MQHCRLPGGLCGKHLEHLGHLLGGLWRWNSISDTNHQDRPCMSHCVRGRIMQHCRLPGGLCGKHLEHLGDLLGDLWRWHPIPVTNHHDRASEWWHCMSHFVRGRIMQHCRLPGGLCGKHLEHLGHVLEDLWRWHPIPVTNHHDRTSERWHCMSHFV